jgi:hypothetical protein
VSIDFPLLRRSVNTTFDLQRSSRRDRGTSKANAVHDRHRSWIPISIIEIDVELWVVQISRDATDCNETLSGPHHASNADNLRHYERCASG